MRELSKFEADHIAGGTEVEHKVIVTADNGIYTPGAPGVNRSINGSNEELYDGYLEKRLLD